MKTYKFAVIPKGCFVAQIITIDAISKRAATRKVKSMFKDAKLIKFTEQVK